MPTQEQRVTVDDGKFTFVVPAESDRILILHHDEPWHEVVLVSHPPAEMPSATGTLWPLYILMCELDAARVVLAQARRTVDLHTEGLAPIEGLRSALELHDRLVSDHAEPSPWVQKPSPWVRDHESGQIQ